MQPFSYWSADQLLVLTDWSTNSTSVAFFFFSFFFSSAFVLKERIEQEVWSIVAPDWSFRTSYWNGCLINNPQTVSSWASWLVVEYDWLCCTHAPAPASVHLSKWWMMWWVWWQCVGSDCSHQTSAKHIFGARGYVRCSEPIMKPHLKAAFWSKSLQRGSGKFLKVNTCWRSLDKWWSTNPKEGKGTDPSHQVNFISYWLVIRNNWSLSVCFCCCDGAWAWLWLGGWGGFFVPLCWGL